MKWLSTTNNVICTLQKQVVQTFNESRQICLQEVDIHDLENMNEFRFEVDAAAPATIEVHLL